MLLNEYTFKVKLCDGKYCDGGITVGAENEDDAYDMAMDYISTKLAEALPDLDISIEIELEDMEDW